MTSVHSRFSCPKLTKHHSVSDSVILSMALCRYTFKDKWLLRQVSSHPYGTCSHLCAKTILGGHIIASAMAHQSAPSDHPITLPCFLRQHLSQDMRKLHESGHMRHSAFTVQAFIHPSTGTFLNNYRLSWIGRFLRYAGEAHVLFLAFIGLTVLFM